MTVMTTLPGPAAASCASAGVAAASPATVRANAMNRYMKPSCGCSNCDGPQLSQTIRQERDRRLRLLDDAAIVQADECAWFDGTNVATLSPGSGAGRPCESHTRHEPQA